MDTVTIALHVTRTRRLDSPCPTCLAPALVTTDLATINEHGVSIIARITTCTRCDPEAS